MFLKSTFRTIGVLLLSAFLMLPVQAQSVKELENQRKQALKKLEATNKMLNETKKSQRSSMNKLNIIGKSISERKELIKNINTEINKLDTQISQLNQEKQELETNLGKLKANYIQLVRQAHMKYSAYDKLVFVLSSQSFDQGMRRIRYIKEVTNFQKQQANKMELVKVQIIQKNDTLQHNKTNKVEVVNVKQSEAQKLSKDQQKEKGYLTDLQKKEAKLRDDLKIQQKKANDLNRKIEQIIAEEMRRAEQRRIAAEKKRLAEENERRERAKATQKNETASKSSHSSSSKSTPAVREEERPSQSVSVLTKEEALISGGFERNRGRLPWPTTNGFIRGHFGVQQHPVLKYVTTNNKGIYIQTPAGSTARAVFEGVVSAVFLAPGSNWGVIVTHGNYRTVYANLVQVCVSNGQKISGKQALGKVYTDSENDNKTELYFQIYNGKNLQNPESWISR